MRTLIACLLLLTVTHVSAQHIADYKTKTPANEKERTLLLDLFRTRLNKIYNQQFVFVVKTFNVTNNYAWLIVDVQQKNGQPPHLTDDDGFYDCCHAEALFEKSGGKWQVKEGYAFATDAWYDRLWERTKAPRALFGY